MDAARQYAYRSILYFAMLDLRIAFAASRAKWWNIPARRRAIRRLRYCNALADWLHNLAEFSRRDFEHFDEDRFWRYYDTLEKHFGDFTALYPYRSRFNDQLAKYDPNNR